MHISFNALKSVFKFSITTQSKQSRTAAVNKMSQSWRESVIVVLTFKKRCEILDSFRTIVTKRQKKKKKRSKLNSKPPKHHFSGAHYLHEVCGGSATQWLGRLP